MRHLDPSFFLKKQSFLFPCLLSLVLFINSSHGVKDFLDSSSGENFDAEPSSSPATSPSQNNEGRPNKTQTFHELLVATWTKNSRERLADAESRDSIWTVETPSSDHHEDDDNSRKSSQPQNSSYNLSEEESPVSSSSGGKKLGQNGSAPSPSPSSDIRRNHYDEDSRLSQFYSTLPADSANVYSSGDGERPQKYFMTSLTPPIIYRPNPYPLMDVSVNDTESEEKDFPTTEEEVPAAAAPAASSTIFSFLGNTKKLNSRPSQVTTESNHNGYDDVEDDDGGNYGNDVSSFPEEMEIRPTTVDEVDYDNEENGGGWAEDERNRPGRRSRPMMINVYMNQMMSRAHSICSLYFGRGRLCRREFL